jgi:hypothetical protein
LTREDERDAVFVARLRQPVLTHAFERALEDARSHMAAFHSLEGEEPQEDGAVQRFRSSLDTLSGLSGGARYVASRSLNAAYKAEAEQARKRERVEPLQQQHRSPPPPPPREERPYRAKRPEPIKLVPGLGVRELERLRRQYALANHPDRVASELREEAARLMAEANAAIDKALMQAKRRGRD